MKLRLLVVAGIALAFATNALAGAISDVKYKLYYQSPSGDVRVSSSDPLPSGSNAPPDNYWRYEYTVYNKSPNALYQFFAFFNSDNVNRAGWLSGTAPVSWTITKQGPKVGNYDFKIRYQTTIVAAKVPSGGTLTCVGVFPWTGELVPGPQNYDAVNDGGSESGVTVEDIATPTRSETWGRIKALYQ